MEYHNPSYQELLKKRAKDMRNNSTKGEIKFWCELLRKRETGYQFYRQKVIGNYIVDFYCHQLKLVIEIDGTSHIEKKEYDSKRDEYFNSLNIEVIHYDDNKVLNNFHIIEKDFNERIRKRAKMLNKSPFYEGSTPRKRGEGRKRADQNDQP